MTTTPRTMITSALRKLGNDPEETPSGTDLAVGLEILNQMLNGWKGQGVDIGHQDFAIDDDVSVELAPQFHEGAIALLGIALASDMPGRTVTPMTLVVAQQGWSALLAAYFDSSVDSDLVPDRMFQHRRRWGVWR